MSEIAGQTGPTTGATGKIPGEPRHRTAATAVVHESYSFACMRCGHGWEQAYEIEHRLDTGGTEFVTYVADGRVVPSPLSRPTCVNCDGHVVRIMRAGQVSSVQSLARRPAPGRPRRPADASATASAADADTSTDVSDGQGGAGAAGPSTGPAGRQHHWHLSDLLHPFQHRRAG
ncbi:hypothetical protein [Streptomyces fructofermentans]|uniref:Uncharacterized protein n=1 Tax=Streptomyces fructofermentans TaxID=152141 RepID=A0A918N7U7_9ACTN|nr:hypothetical protein GCM10010515_10320 [Streptomyces fructofermentans]